MFTVLTLFNSVCKFAITTMEPILRSFPPPFSSSFTMMENCCFLNFFHLFHFFYNTSFQATQRDHLHNLLHHPHHQHQEQKDLMSLQYLSLYLLLQEYYALVPSRRNQPPLQTQVSMYTILQLCTSTVSTYFLCKCILPV